MVVPTIRYAQTTDWGKTWTTVDGRKLELPLSDPENPARVINYSAQGKLMYTIDLRFDHRGFPVLLYITSRGYKPGPENDPREWTFGPAGAMVTCPACDGQGGLWLPESDGDCGLADSWSDCACCEGFGIITKEHRQKIEKEATDGR